MHFLLLGFRTCDIGSMLVSSADGFTPVIILRALLSFLLPNQNCIETIEFKGYGKETQNSFESDSITTMGFDGISSQEARDREGVD